MQHFICLTPSFDNRPFKGSINVPRVHESSFSALLQVKNTRYAFFAIRAVLNDKKIYVSAPLCAVTCQTRMQSTNSTHFDA